MAETENPKQERNAAENAAASKDETIKNNIKNKGDEKAKDKMAQSMETETISAESKKAEAEETTEESKENKGLAGKDGASASDNHEADKSDEESPVVEDEPIIEDTDSSEIEIQENVSEEDLTKKALKRDIDVSGWSPKTAIGKKVKSRDITDIDEILDNGYKIMEPEIAEALLPGLESDLLLIGQSKGKFGGGQRRIFKQTQKKTKEGNKPKFSTFAVVGNNNGYVGFGLGKAKETVPAREKAIRKAKLNVIKIRRGCGSWQCNCKTPHSIPFLVEGKCGSVRIRLMPAPKGTGLCIEKECAKILKLAGIKDIWSKSFGQTKSKINMLKACVDALKKLSTTKINSRHYSSLGIVDGSESADANELVQEA